MEYSESPSKRRKLSEYQAQEDAPASEYLPASTTSVLSQQDEIVSDTLSLVSGEAPAKAAIPGANASSPAQQLSKNQLKKLRKKEEWEAGRASRKIKRKEKNQEKKVRRREQKQEEREARQAQGLDPFPERLVVPVLPIRLPITILIDCGFDDKMAEKERISLGSQLTRSYSDNSKAPFQAHMYISSWNGLLKERFDTVLRKHHQNWKGVKFTSENFVEAAKMAGVAMKRSKRNTFAGVFANLAANGDNKAAVESKEDLHHGNGIEPEDLKGSNQTSESIAETLPEHTSFLPNSELEAQSEVIYLTSDSPYTLTELKPFSTYIVGGLVDKNQHKGICYKTACDQGVKTAKLPISQYMEMQSRFVLATNHVVEIMIRWLECGDWGEAFMRVIPKRKGGKLKGDTGDGEAEVKLEPGPEEEEEEKKEEKEEKKEEEEKKEDDDEDDDHNDDDQWQKGDIDSNPHAGANSAFVMNRQDQIGFADQEQIQA